MCTLNLAMKTIKKLKLIGRREWVNFPSLNIVKLEAKIDTGAYTSSIHCKSIHLINEELHVTFLDNSNHIFSNYSLKKIKNSFGETEERFILKTIIHIARKKIHTTISLSDRANMRYPVLIGRRLLKNKFIVDVSKVYTNGII